MFLMLASAGCGDGVTNTVTQSESKVITPEVYPATAGLILCTSPAGVIGFKELGLCTDSSLSATRVTCRCVFCSIFDYLEEFTVLFCGKPAVAGYTSGVMTFDSDCETSASVIELELLPSNRTKYFKSITDSLHKGVDAY